MLIDITEPGSRENTCEKTIAIGIDLGTTNSLVAVVKDGRAEVIRDDERAALLPSIVAFGDDGGVKVGSGDFADMQVVSSIKRLMGRGREDIKSLHDAMPYELDDSASGMVALKINGRSVTPVEISAEILKVLKERAEKSLGEDVKKAVITVPAYFDDAARAATRDAAKLAGLEVLRLVNEPTAAALAYGLDNAAEGIYAIYDLGGGTFDISLLKMEKGVFQVLSTAGNTALGGDDFDHRLAEYFIARQADEIKLNSKDAANILAKARQAKEELTTKDSVSLVAEINGKSIKCEITRDNFEQLILPEIDETIEICKNAIEDAALSKEDVKGVVLVGGSTRVPLVREKVEWLFGKAPLTDVNPDEVVAVGAALQADALTGSADTLLIDVNPLSLGLETMGGLVEKIIQRNTPIPTSAAQKFTTYQDGQDGMKIHVLQGEREMVEQCRSLAEFELTGIPPMQAGAAVIEVTFTIDADGLLTVSAREETTGKEQQVAIKPAYGLPAEKIEQMLADSMKNAKSDIIARLLAESKIEAKRSIGAVESALKEDSALLSKEYKKQIEDKINFIKTLLEGDERDLIDYEVQQLEHICGEFAEKRVNKALGKVFSGMNIDEAEKKLNENKG